MVEINLLPWRQYAYAYQQKRIKHLLLCTILFVATVFILIHAATHVAVKKVNFHVIQLQNRLAEMHDPASQNTIFLTNTVKDFYSNQKRLASVLEKIMRAEACHIQLSKINFMEKSILWVGDVRSAYAVACWIKSFRHTPIQKFKVENSKDSDFQKISFMIE
jgi:hypothetical protein